MSSAVRPRRWRRTVLAGLCVLAGLIRVYRLDSIPPALFRDEAEKVYNAFCLATTARDCTGHFLPLFVNVFGVTTSTIYQYLAVPFVWLFGVGEWAARLPAATAATLTVAVLFLWMLRAWGLRAALWAALFLAFSPWHIVFSRWAQQGILVPLWLGLAMLGWEWFLAGRRSGILVSAAACGLAVYTYDVARAFVPLLVVTHIFLFRRELARHWRWSLAALVVLLIASLPTLHLLFTRTAAAQARFSRISIFAPGTPWTYAAGMFARNYFAHFSPAFLLLSGDQELRHGVGVGVLTAAEFTALLAGLAVLLRRRSPRDLLLVAWLLYFPVAASLTREGIPHALRCIVALPGAQAVAGIGCMRLEVLLRRWISGRRTRQIFLLAQLVAFLPFAWRYFGDYPARSAVAWQYGVKQALRILAPMEPQLDRIAFVRIFGAEYLVAAYRALPPAEFRPDQPRCGKFEWLPPDMQLDAWPPLRNESVAVVTLPLGPPPSGVATSVIHAPNSQDVVAVIYLSDHVRERLLKLAGNESRHP